MIGAVQKQAARHQGVNEFPEFCGQRSIFELFRRRQIEAVVGQGVERADEAMRFQRQNVFQKRFLHLGIAVAHPAIHHFTAGNVRDFTAKFLDVDFPVNRIKAERVVIGWFGLMCHVVRIIRRFWKVKA